MTLLSFFLHLRIKKSFPNEIHSYTIPYPTLAEEIWASVNVYRYLFHLFTRSFFSLSFHPRLAIVEVNEISVGNGKAFQSNTRIFRNKKEKTSHHEDDFFIFLRERKIGTEETRSHILIYIGQCTYVHLLYRWWLYRRDKDV